MEANSEKIHGCGKYRKWGGGGSSNWESIRLGSCLKFETIIEQGYWAGKKRKQIEVLSRQGSSAKILNKNWDEEPEGDVYKLKSTKKGTFWCAPCEPGAAKAKLHKRDGEYKIYEYINFLCNTFWFYYRIWGVQSPEHPLKMLQSGAYCSICLKLSANTYEMHQLSESSKSLYTKRVSCSSD